MNLFSWNIFKFNCNISDNFTPNIQSVCSTKSQHFKT